MTRTLLRINWLNLKRDYVALGLVFVLPVIFFTIFAGIFGGTGNGGGGGSGGASALRIIVVDEDQTDISKRFAKAIDDQDALASVTAPRATDENPTPQPYTRDAARRRVREGDFPAAVIIPKDFGTTFGNFTGDPIPVEVIYDEANPIAQHTVAGLMQAAAMMAAPDILMEKGVEQLGRFGGGMTPQQRLAIETMRPFLRGDKPWEELDGEAAAAPDATTSPAQDSPSSAGGFSGMVSVAMTPAREPTTATEKSPSMVAYYAAGIGVMFLLFSMVGASGSLLEEETTGTLERLLTSNFGMGKLLAGSWLFYSIVGFAQVCLMFVYGALVFKLDLFTPNHLAGFLVMTAFTSMAAAAFALILATLCRSRAQLSGISTIVILIMSALGGSMVPRFIASDFFAKTSPFTFNGWALDGYLKVFWHDDPEASVVQSVIELTPQVIALGLMTLVFLGLSRVLARRWEAV